MADKKETKTTKKTTTKKVVKKATKPAVKKTTPKKEVKVETKKGDKFAVIAISGVQLKVYVGKEYEVEKLEGKKGDKIDKRSYYL